MRDFGGRRLTLRWFWFEEGVVSSQWHVVGGPNFVIFQLELGCYNRHQISWFQVLV